MYQRWFDARDTAVSRKKVSIPCMGQMISSFYYCVSGARMRIRANLIISRTDINSEHFFSLFPQFFEKTASLKKKSSLVHCRAQWNEVSFFCFYLMNKKLNKFFSFLWL